jgi:hypothetical protein
MSKSKAKKAAPVAESVAEPVAPAAVDAPKACPVLPRYVFKGATSFLVLTPGVYTALAAEGGWRDGDGKPLE